MKVFALFLGLALAVFISIASANTDYKDICESTLTDPLVNPDKVVERLRSLKPIALDYPNVREAIRNLISEISELHPDFQRMSHIENDLMSGALSAEKAEKFAGILRNHYASEASKLLNSGEAKSTKRKLVEGHRILMSRSEKLALRAQYIAEHPEEIEKYKEEQEEINKKQKKLQKGSKKNLKEKSEKRKREERNPEEKSSEDKSEEEKSSEDKSEEEKSSEDKSEEDKKNEKNSDEAKEKAEEQVDEKSDKSENKPSKEKSAKKEAPEKSAEKSKNNSSESKDEQSEENESLEQDSNSSSESEDVQGKEEGEGEGDESFNEEGEGSEDAQGFSEEEGDKAGDTDGIEKRGGKKSDVTREIEEKGELDQEKGNDGLSEGGATGKHALSQKLADYFKDLLNKRNEIDKTMEDKKNFEERDSSRSHAEEEIATDIKSEHDSSVKHGKKAENKKMLPELDEARVLSIIKKHLDKLWAETLRQYQSHDQILNGLINFRVLCDKLATTYRRTDFLTSYAARAAEMHELLEAAQVQYKDLESLGLSMISAGNGHKQNLLRKLRFLDRIFTELSKIASLNEKESDVHQMVQELLSKLESGKSTAEDKQVAEAFLEQMMGPLSRRALKGAYPSADSKEAFNWTSLLGDLKAGKLNDLLIFGRMKPFMNILLKQTMKPKYYREHSGDRVPVNEAEPTLEMAEELDRFAYFHRDGSPAETDLLRLLSGDMLENIYQDEVVKSDPHNPQPKKVTIIVYDISGSMGNRDKYVLRNALIGAYIDRSQTEVALGREEHIIYTMAFDARPHDPERLGNIKEAQSFFDRLRAAPIYAGGDDSISGALIKVYEMIAQHQKEGGDLDRANILLITDAIAPVQFERIKDAHDKVDPKVEVVLNAITLGDLNSDVEKLVAQQGGEGKGKLGRVYHRHIPYDEVGELLNAGARLKTLETISRDYSSSADTHIDNEILVRFKQRLVGLSAHRELGERLSNINVKAFTRELTQLKSVVTSPSIDALIQVFYETVKSPIGSDFSELDRMEYLSAFLDSVAEHYHVNRSEVFEQVSKPLREKILGWLKG